MKSHAKFSGAARRGFSVIYENPPGEGGYPPPPPSVRGLSDFIFTIKMGVIYINLLVINFKSLVKCFKLRVKSFNTPVNCFNSKVNCFKLDVICFKLDRKRCRCGVCMYICRSYQLYTSPHQAQGTMHFFFSVNILCTLFP